MSPGGDIGTWIGFTGLGFGVIILYSAVKGVPLFGPTGIITNALTKGQLTHVGPQGKTTTSGGNATKLGGNGNPLTNPIQAIQHPSQINPLGIVGSNIDTITQKLFGVKPIPTSGGSLLHDVENGVSTVGHAIASAPGKVWHALGSIF